jgi:hypothetical protein
MIENSIHSDNARFINLIINFYKSIKEQYQKMSGDMSGHRERASNFLIEAKNFEGQEKWQEAFESYMKSL